MRRAAPWPMNLAEFDRQIVDVSNDFDHGTSLAST